MFGKGFRLSLKDLMQFLALELDLEGPGTTGLQRRMET